MRSKIFNALKVSSLAIVLSLGLSYVYAWTAPAVLPTGGNAATPINISSTPQTKAGTLSVTGIKAEGGGFIGYENRPISVIGISTQPSSLGIYGEGVGYGVKGVVLGDGSGVRGSSEGTNGIGTEGSGAIGVSGLSTGGIFGYGVQGRGSVGVFGIDSVGNSFGVYGTSPSGVGTYGYGGTVGVQGVGTYGVQGSGTVADFYSRSGKGILFADGTRQTTATSIGKKICSYSEYNMWVDTINVPDTWTMTDCYQLGEQRTNRLGWWASGCMLDHTLAWGTPPSPNCGWTW